MELRCRICAGSLTIDPVTRIATCDYCGTKQVLPLFGDDSSKALFDRGIQYLQHNEYDKAESIFIRLLSVNPSDGEIYWDLLQCKYGVTYAKDPKTEKYIPTCNRTLTDSIFKDEYFLKAIELSSADKADLYRKDAEIIERIQRGILEVSRKEKPFDIFISYKETDENGYRTRDSIEAQKLYEKLTELGYRVFFSRITLESKIGEEYEPYIYAALSSSKVMITVCSSENNIQSAWVKNEWSRFLIQRRTDASKTLIPVYFDMDPKNLPEEFSLLAAQELATEGFEQELLRGIKKLVTTPVEQKEYKKRRNRILAVVAATIAVFAIPIGAYRYYITVKNAEIVAEKARAEEDAKAQAAKEAEELEEQYRQAKNLFDTKDYDSAKIKLNALGEYRDSADLALKCTYYADYDAAVQLYYDRDFPKAVWALEKIGEYDDVKDSLEKARRAWRSSISSVAVANVQVFSFSQGGYYINANGGVDCFIDNPGALNVQIKKDSEGNIIDDEAPLSMNEHGKIVSIGGSSPLYALYEDGFVANSAIHSKDGGDWNNVIQITDEFNFSNVALFDDGTLEWGYSYFDDNGEYDEWLDKCREWKHIVKLDWTQSKIMTGEISDAYLIGLDSDGHMLGVAYCDTDGYVGFGKDGWESAKSFIGKLDSIKDFSINGSGSRLYIAALDKNNVMHILNDQGESSVETNGIKDFWMTADGKILIINSKNELKELGSDKTILEGIIYINDGYCVSQSGSIYSCDGSPANAKTSIKDVWLER